MLNVGLVLGLSATGCRAPTIEEGAGYVGIVSAPSGATATGELEYVCPADASGNYLAGFLFDVAGDPQPNGTEECPFGCDDIQSQPQLGPLERTDLSSLGRDLPPALAPYCTYVPVDPTLADQLDPPQVSGVGGLVQSQKVVAAFSVSDETEDLLAYFAEKTHYEVSYCDGPAVDPATTWLTFVDTYPDVQVGVDAPVAGADAGAFHGLALAEGIHELLGLDGTPANVQVRTRNGLPLRQPESGTKPEWHGKDGGHFGVLDYLAQRIHREVRRWDEKRADDPEVGGLVLNLSLGWHPDYGGQNVQDDNAEETERSDVLAVYRALRDARCRGALIVAAAGNRTAGGTDKNPMFPSSWTNFALTPEECADALGPGAPPLVLAPGLTEVPLVYAASAVDDQSTQLVVSRRDSIAYLTAYGQDFYSTRGYEMGLPTLTGTSPAAAVVSGLAAKIWSEDRSLTPDEVMAAVWDGAAETELVAGPGWDRPLLFSGPTDSRDARRAASPNCHGDEPPVPPPWTVCDCGEAVGLCGPIPTVQETTSTSPTESPIFVNEMFQGFKKTAAYAPYAAPTPEAPTCPACRFDPTTNLMRVQLQMYTVGANLPPMEFWYQVNGEVAWQGGTISGMENGRTYLVDLTPTDSALVPTPGTVRAALLYWTETVGSTTTSYIAQLQITSVL